MACHLVGQAIIWTNAGILLIQTLGTDFNEILSEIHIFSFKTMSFKMSSAKWWPFCLSLNGLNGPSSETYMYVPYQAKKFQCQALQ